MLFLSLVSGFGQGVKRLVLFRQGNLGRRPPPHRKS